MSAVSCKASFSLSAIPEKRRLILEKAASLVGALMYLDFARTFVTRFMYYHRLSDLLYLVMVSMVAFFFVTRRVPKQTNLSLYDWFVAVYGTFLSLLLRPAPNAHASTVLTLVQSVGTLITIMGVISLNRSFGLVAANRGVRTVGLYNYIRHPIYTGYFVSLSAFWAQNVTLLNTVVLVLWMTFEILRIFSEEKILSADPVYAEYKTKVRWRMLPYVF